MGKDTSALSDTFLNTPNTVEVGEGLSINAFPITGSPELDTALIRLAHRPPFSMFRVDVEEYLEPNEIKAWADQSKDEVRLGKILVNEIWIPGSELLEYIVIGGLSAYALLSEEVIGVVNSTKPTQQMATAISEQLYSGLYIQILQRSVPNP